MQLKVGETESGYLTISLQGRLDCETVPGIRKQLLKIARGKGVNSIRVDITNVTGLDTSGLAVFVELMKQLSRKNGRLRLAGVSENIERMIRLTRLDEVLEIQNTLNNRV